MLYCGLLGKKLSHSYSPEIHKMLGRYKYDLFEKEEHEIESFFKNSTWDSINVTIPYKKTVIPYLDSLSDTAKKTGSVNTIIRDLDGKLYGDNTDVYGFCELLRHSGISVSNKKTLILGSGGASASIYAALEKLNAAPVVISRTGENNYNNLERHYDAEIIVNATPVGMYPNAGVSPLDLSVFPHCVGVLDAIYNPARTALLMQAEELGIPFENGLYMLVAQAKRSSELFTGIAIPDAATERIYRKLKASMENIVLIGMPGVGKTTLAKMLAARLGKRLLDSDTEITACTGSTPEQIITQNGEDAFRDIECAVIAELGKQSGAVIATGGGSVLRKENYPALHQNGTVIWIRRELSLLPDNGRPLSQKHSPEKLYSERKAKYAEFADLEIDIEEDADKSLEMILEALNREIK